MPSSDADSLQARMVSAKTGPHSPLASVLLTREHITEALKKSTDNGATLDLAHKSLTDVGEDGAAALAGIGQGLEDDKHDNVSRRVGPRACLCRPLTYLLQMQNCAVS